MHQRTSLRPNSDGAKSISRTLPRASTRQALWTYLRVPGCESVRESEASEQSRKNLDGNQVLVDGPSAASQILTAPSTPALASTPDHSLAPHLTVSTAPSCAFQLWTSSHSASGVFRECRRIEPSREDVASCAGCPEEKEREVSRSRAEVVRMDVAVVMLETFARRTLAPFSR
jgi:hypothetical protein